MTRLRKGSERSSSIQITFIWIRCWPPRIARKAISLKRLRSTPKPRKQRICRVAALLSPTRAWAATSTRKIFLVSFCKQREAIRLCTFDCRGFRRAWRQRRSLSRTRTRLCRTLWGITVDRISSRVSCAPFRRSFPSAFTANQPLAGRNFDHHRDNPVRDDRSESGKSFDSQNWGKVAVTYAKWTACEDSRLLLRPDER